MATPPNVKPWKLSGRLVTNVDLYAGSGEALTQLLLNLQDGQRFCPI